MNNAGNRSSRAGYWILGIALVIAVLAIIFGIVVGPRAVGVLYALSAPPDAPVPRGMQLLSQDDEVEVHGVDSRVYGSHNLSVCEVVEYYREMDGRCRVEPDWCVEGAANTTERYSEPVAQCSGDMDFSIFTMRWSASVSAGDRQGQYAIVDVTRRIFWTGGF